MDGSLQAVCVYDKMATIYANSFHNPSDHICDFLKLVRVGGRILDVGCGHGVNSNYMMSKNFKVVGIDLSSGMLKLAKGKYPLIDFRLSDMRKLSFESGYFDGIFVSYSLIHIPKKHVLFVLRLLNSFLKSEGALYASVQLGKSQEQYLISPLRQDQEIFVNVFSNEEIRSFLEESGFSITKCFARKAMDKEFIFSKHFVIASKTDSPDPKWLATEKRRLEHAFTS